jgi:hypothetical protein
MQVLFPGQHCIIDQDICESHASARFHIAAIILSSAKMNERVRIGVTSGMMQQRSAIFALAISI